LTSTNLAEPAVAASGTQVEEADIAIAEKLGEHRHDPLVRGLGAVSEIADQAPSLIACGALLAAGMVFGKPRIAEASARMLGSLLVAAAMKSAVKKLVARTRPRVLLEEDRYEVQALGPDGGNWHSFPSGHTAGAVAAARGFARAYPNAAMPAYGAAAMIGAVQIPRAKHYPLDVAAGAVVGIVAEGLVAFAAASFARRENSRPPPDSAMASTDHLLRGVVYPAE
jgi:membrane-associated phospholipid phosphatase